MNNKVLIASDSTCDLSKELQEKYNVKILPLYITFGEDSYKDNEEINLKELYNQVKVRNELPKEKLNIEITINKATAEENYYTPTSFTF